MLKSVKKKYLNDLHHSIDPSETVKIALKTLALCGKNVFDELEEVGHYDTMGLPVYKVRCKNSYNEWGKGISPDQCKASALMERLERFSAVFANHKERARIVQDSYINIRKKHDSIPRKMFILNNVQRLFFKETEMDEIDMSWTEASDIFNEKKYYIPAQMVYFSFPPGKFNDPLCSTGLASGNTLEEAIMQAIAEVIERHVVNVIYFNKLATKQIDLETITNPELKKLISGLKEKGFVVVANDYSFGFNLSSVSAFIFHPKEKIVFNKDSYSCCGTATNPEAALIRAITEIAQSRAVDINRNNVIKLEKETFSDSPLSKEMRDEYEFRTQNKENISIQKLPNISADDFKVEIERVIEDLNKKNYKTLLFDLTLPDLNIPVVRIMIPGLQPNIKLLRRDPFHRYSRVSPHLDIYNEALKRALDAQFTDFPINEVHSV